MAGPEVDPLTQAGITVVEQRDTEVARVRFAGTLRGQPVMWDARVLTLRRYRRERGGGPARALIEVVGVADDHVRASRVGDTVIGPAQNRAVPTQSSPHHNGSRPRP